MYKYVLRNILLIKKPFANYVLVGHTHIQYETSIEQTLIVNPGSVGLARDGGQACYAIYENGIVTLKRIEYDVQKTVFDLKKSPLPENIINGLINVLLN